MATAAVLAACAAFLYGDGIAQPIGLWDESRNIVNALEMQARGLSLVTTYGWVPDLWNTKPPLLIWLMWASVGVFGASEWALRLPSVLSTLGLVWLVQRCVRRATGSMTAAALAAALLALSPALFGEHGARTADYDALLILCTTTYCWLGFAGLRRRRARAATLGLAAAAVAAAMLAKSVAGLMPGVGLAGWALATGRWRRVVRDRRYLAAAVLAFMPVALFLLAREAAGTGYLAAVWRNDLGGRFAHDAVGVARPWSFYLAALAAGWFAAPVLLPLAPVAWRWLRPRERLAAGQAAAVASAVLIAASVAQTKLHHYLLPAVPFFVVLAAITAVGLGRGLRASGSPVVRTGIALALLLTACQALSSAVVRRYVAPAVPEGARSGGYGALLAALSPRPVTVIDHGFVNDGRPGYAPVLRAYQLLAAARGQRVVRADGVESAAGIVASCDPAIVRQLAAVRPVLLKTIDCIAVDGRRRGGG